MDIAESQLALLLGAVFVVALLLSASAVRRAGGLLRAHRSLGRLYWYVIATLDRHRRR
jgi:hypothetical protein